MSHQSKITQSNPKTGASPAEQTAENFASKSNQGDSLGMMENDKLIYELVQKNVEFAGNQLSDNLWFNSIVLTDVLYENLYKLLQGKFNESDFVEWAAQELLNRGCVYKSNESLENN